MKNTYLLVYYHTLIHVFNESVMLLILFFERCWSTVKICFFSLKEEYLFTCMLRNIFNFKMVLHTLSIFVVSNQVINYCT